jgi:hypothetical protein
VCHGDQRAPDQLGQFENRLAIVIPEDPVFVLNDHYVATIEMSCCCPDAHRRARIELHAHVAQAGNRRSVIDHTHNVHFEIKGDTTEIRSKGSGVAGDATSSGWISGHDPDTGPSRAPGQGQRMRREL